MKKYVCPTCFTPHFISENRTTPYYCICGTSLGEKVIVRNIILPEEIDKLFNLKKPK